MVMMEVPITDDNFVVVPIFNPSAYCTPFCGPLSLDRFILVCVMKSELLVCSVM